MPTVQFREWRDLKAAGFDLLTGEACGLMLRVLVDVTEKGRLLFCKAFGLDPLTNRLGEPWNRGTKDDPHVASVMLSGDTLPVLAVFAALEVPGVVECHVCHKDGQWQGVYGFSEADLPGRDEWVEVMRRLGYNVHRRAYFGTAGDRNRHEMSGRVA